LPFEVRGDSPNASDRLIVNDDGLSDLVAHHEGPGGRSVSVSFCLFAPVDYSEIERVDITPLNAVTGGTGIDGLGRLIVFDYDDLESNDSLANATFLGPVPIFISHRNIDPGGIALPPPFPGVPGDADWYEFRPGKIGTFRFEVLFEEINTLANGRTGLPNGGDLAIQVYRENGSLIASSDTIDDDESLDISMAENNSYFLRVFGSTADVINIYDLNVVEVDVLGPQITSVVVSSAPGYDLFDPKPSVNGPTPLIDSITLNLRDLLDFDLFNRAPGDLYDALDLLAAGSPEHYEVRGDHVGLVSIQEVIVNNNPAVVGQIATATVDLVFAEPLPDDRFSLTVFDSLIDPPVNAADGGTNANEPQDNPTFPSGDGIAGGDFVARFTVDSRPEIGSAIPEGITIDINGNFVWDPATGEIGDDATNVDLTFTLPVANPDGSIGLGGYSVHDLLFAGKFSPLEPQIANNGFDQLAAYGNSQELGNIFRWLIDTNSDGVVNPADGDIISDQPLQADIIVAGAIPVAGNFDGNLINGDEIGLYFAGTWAFDTNKNYVIDAADNFANGDLLGHPIVGDFDGNGIDDLGVFNNDQFFFDLSFNPLVDANATIDNSFLWGFPGVLDRPVAADMDQDGIDDVGLWVPRDSAQNPAAAAEWFFLMSAGQDAIAGTVNTLDHPFEPVPFGNDLYAEFGNELALPTPIVGNFDPPVSSATAPDPQDAVPGDYDRSGTVDAGDFTIWKESYGQTGLGMAADGNGDGVVNAADMTIWRNNLGASSTSSLLVATGDSSDFVAQPANLVAVAPAAIPAIEAAFMVEERAEDADAHSLPASSVDAIFADADSDLLLLADRVRAVNEDESIDFELLEIAAEEVEVEEEAFAVL
ncbi:MAG: dockerin type I domain-containing protein, partial [Aeoliella sp.]